MSFDVRTAPGVVSTALVAMVHAVPLWVVLVALVFIRSMTPFAVQVLELCLDDRERRAARKQSRCKHCRRKAGKNIRRARDRPP